MSVYENILKNFQEFDAFLCGCKENDKKDLQCLKMMYAIHMENNRGKIGIVEYLKQTVRFLIKFMSIPFVQIRLKNVESSNKIAIVKNTAIENRFSKKYGIVEVEFQRFFSFNSSTIGMYIRVIQLISILFKNDILNKRYIFLLLHRLIDYLMVLKTVEIGSLKVLLVENDRTPYNLGLIHLFQKRNLKTIKYDNWLIDSINHNDIYCDIYFYPSLYHKGVIQSFAFNKNLQYVKGGFISWDKLSGYKLQHSGEEIIVSYFTQFGIDFNVHLNYISDIEHILDARAEKFTIHVKIHPRESVQKYASLLKNQNIVLHTSIDNYELISRSNFCFSVFSTISLEAKHINPHSYFINYHAKDYKIVNYEKLGLDLLDTKEKLREVLSNEYAPIDSKKFIKDQNCTYSDSSDKLYSLAMGYTE